MSTETEKNTQTASVKPKKNKKKRKKIKPQVVYSHEEIAAIDKESFWDTIHEGVITSVLPEHILVELNKDDKKLEVFIPKEELLAIDTKKAQDSIRFYLEAEIVKPDEDVTHRFVGSELKAIELTLLEKAQEKQSSKESVEGFVVSEVKGGYCVALFAKNRQEADDGIGLKAFLPKTLCSSKRFDPEAENLSNQLLELRVSEVEPLKGNIIVSRKEILEKDQEKLQEEFFLNHKVGDVVEGVIATILPYGAFIDLGSISGFVHSSDVSWSNKPNVKNLLFVGETTKAKIIELNTETKKVKLSIKDLFEDPWQNIDKNFKPGSEVDGVVVSFADFGAFVRLQSGVEGLIHIGEMSWSRVEHPSNVLSLGEVVKAAVIRVDKDKKRISLSTKAVQVSPVEQLSQHFPIGAVVKTKVHKVEDFGLFVSLREDCLGFVPKSEVSWMRLDAPLSKQFNPGDDIEVAILGYEAKRQRVTCSIKRLNEDPWQKIKREFKRGTVHKAKVISVIRAGVLCELQDGLTGFCPKNQLSSYSPESTRFSTKVGDDIDVYISAIEPSSQRIALSQKMAVESETKKAYEAYLDQQGKGKSEKATLGDALKNLK